MPSTARRRLQRVLLTVGSLALLAPHAACAQPTSAGAGTCAVAGTYELDREAGHALIVEHMDSVIAALGDRPAEREGSTARVRWEAERGALERVRERAAERQMIPRMTAELAPDGTFTHTRYSLDGTDAPDDVQVGRWEIDDACRTIVIDVNDHQTTAEVASGRLTLDIDPPPGMESLAVEFVEVE